MNEIQRIHLARTAYNIETPARSILQDYIEKLRAYTGDDEIVADIELRMTEILAERQVKPDGTIVVADVEAMIEQLGEPADFSDGTTELAATTEGATHQWLRNPNGALLGGVCSGFATYTNTNVWIWRLLSLVLTGLTSGAFIVLYVVLWLLLPRVRTAADLLRLQGKPVTATALKGAVSIPPSRDRLFIRAIQLLVAGIAFIGVIGALVAAGYATGFSRNILQLFNGSNGTGDYSMTAAHIAIISGIIAAVFAAATLAIVGMMALKNMLRRRSVIIAGVCFVVALIATAGSATAVYVQHQAYERFVIAHTQRGILAVPAGFAAVKALVNEADSEVTYVTTTDGAYGISYELYRGNQSGPLPQIKVENGVATLRYTAGETTAAIAPHITVSGPALDKITVQSGLVTYQTGSQPSLDVKVRNGASVQLDVRTLDTLQADLGFGRALTAYDLAVKQLTVTMAEGANVYVDQADSVSATVPTTCGQNPVSLELARITSGQVTINQVPRAAQSSDISCGVLTVHNNE